MRRGGHAAIPPARRRRTGRLSARVSAHGQDLPSVGNLHELQRRVRGPPRRPAPRRCGGELACSTCHVILEQGLFDSLDEPDEEEVDMLDLAWGLEDTSRLCCQLKVGPHLEGAVFTLPEDPY